MNFRIWNAPQCLRINLLRTRIIEKPNTVHAVSQCGFHGDHSALSVASLNPGRQDNIVLLELRFAGVAARDGVGVTIRSSSKTTTRAKAILLDAVFLWSAGFVILHGKSPVAPDRNNFSGSPDSGVLPDDDMGG